MPRSGLVVDLEPWPDPARRVSVDGLAAPLEKALGSVRIWRPTEEDEDRAGQGAIADEGLAGVILSGSAAMVDEAPAWVARVTAAVDHWLAARVPVLATCFAHQLVAVHLGGALGSYPRSRVGLAPLHILDDQDRLFGPFAPRAEMLWSHRDHVTTLPPTLVRVAGSDICPVEAYRHRDRPLWGLQAHPESSAALARAIREADPDEAARLAARPSSAYDTPDGARLLESFAAYCADA